MRAKRARPITEHEITEGGGFFEGPKAPRKIRRPSAEPSTTEFLREAQKFRSEILGTLRPTVATAVDTSAHS